MASTPPRLDQFLLWAVAEQVTACSESLRWRRIAWILPTEPAQHAAVDRLGRRIPSDAGPKIGRY
jgi:hypothetical protein